MSAPALRPPVSKLVATAMVRGAAVGLLVLAPLSGRAATFTVNGFTGLFAEENWTFGTGGAPADTGSGTLSTTTMTLTSGTAPPSGNAFAEYEFNTNDLLATYPGFTSGTITFDWSWSSTSPTSLPALDPFYYYIGSSSPVQLPVYGGIGDSSNINNWIVSGSSVTFNVTAGQVFGFRITNDGAGDSATATGTISNFSFAGSYVPQPVEVPGPLPVMAAAAGFAWSRKLRRRLTLARPGSGSH